MTNNNISSTAPSSSSTTGASSSRSDDRARIADLAAEFESMLLVNVLRDMKSSGRWSLAGDEGDTFGAETFDQTIDVELSRYLSKAGGLGLSQRLLSAFDALARIADEAPAAASSSSSSKMSALSSAAASSGTDTSNAVNVFGRLPVSTSSGRTGWNSMRLDAPAYGGSGAEWAGFNNDRALSGGDESSVKDAFFRWTYGSSFNPAGKSKEEIGNFLRDNVQSAREYGLNVLDVDGEKILIETEERGAEWVDVVAGASSANGKWQWLCQTEYGVVGGGALGDALASLRSTPDGESRVRALMTSTTMTGEGLLASMRAEATAAASGGTFILPTNATNVTPSSPEALRTQSAAVTSAYGWRPDPFNGTATFHSGVDLRAEEGDPVASTGAGTVVFSGTDGGYGTSVVVEHANGLTTRYAHLSAALVNPGDLVEDGGIIGRVGQTGRATGPHLHYEVRVDGRAVDPLTEP
jgi:murein DD-endopeptidase MepM/ murein hydrolase activator NlpD/Rod binding domain-containing protein